MPALLALPWYGDGEPPAEPVVVCGTCAMGKKVVQNGTNCGRAFWERFEKPLQDLAGGKKGGGRSGRAEADDNDSKGETEREKAFREKREKKQRESKGKDGGLLKMSEDLKGRDLYELLEVEPCSSPEDVKKSYRKLVLVHHPDKMADPTEDQKKHFLLIQEAFEILSDLDKKRRYESSLDFDDTIPTAFPRGRYAGLDFFQVFRPVFKRNARWSAKPRVPELGDEDTDIETVKAFYEFWYDFESWRDPLAIAEKEEYDLHALDEAECREERRWMERENAKVARRIAAAERERISDLVKAADKNDPRMIAHREKVREEREAEKAAKAAALQAEQERRDAEERARREAEEAVRRIEEAKRLEEKKKREEVKNALKAARQRLRNLHRGAEAVVRHAVHADQLQEVCLRMETDELNAFCDELDAAFAKDSEDFASVIGVMHREIASCGVTPINDASVDLKGSNSGASTISPEDDDDEGSEDDDRSPAKSVRELTPEEIEAERLRRLAEEAAERERAEKRAEEQRKKREAQKKEEEKRQAELRKLEKKEREKVAKEKAKEDKKKEQEAKKFEEDKVKQQQQREQQRAAALQEEAERKRLHEEQLVARAFETDRMKRVTVLEAYDGGLLEQALRGTLLQEGGEEPNAQLRLALRQLAAQLPPPTSAKEAAADQARREAEELCIDLAAACLVGRGAVGAAPEEARARLAGAMSLAVRPSREMPELSKEAKATVKKQRTRARTALLSFLRSLDASEPAAPAAKPRPAGATAPPKETIAAGMELIAAEDGVIFKSETSYDEIGTVSTGMVVVAAGPAVEAEGYAMVPIRPRGTVELRILRAVAGAGAQQATGGAKKKAAADEGGAGAKAAAAGKGAGAGGAKKKAAGTEPELDDELTQLVRLAAANADLAESELSVACYGGFDSAAVLVEATNPKQQEREAPAGESAEAGPAPAAKGGKKKAAKKEEEPEDLDALLEEFGMGKASPKSKKGKK